METDTLSIVVKAVHDYFESPTTLKKDRTVCIHWFLSTDDITELDIATHLDSNDLYW